VEVQVLKYYSLHQPEKTREGKAQANCLQVLLVVQVIQINLEERKKTMMELKAWGMLW
jgi:hypothetical protein